MESDLKIEIFAYKWFCRILLDPERLSRKYDAKKIYQDECLAYPECNEASDCDHLYYAIMFRRWLFKNSYLEEIQKQRNEFRYSQTDFCSYVLRTCNRVDLFGDLTVFERVFATCAFVCCLCLYCLENDYLEIMRYGDICWAMYFDNFADEFYKQGGWNRLKMVAISYKSPINFVDTVQTEEEEDVILIKLRSAIKRYSYFKKIVKIDYDECISMSWVKFHIEYKNGSSDNDFAEYFEDNYSEELKNYTEVENILKQLKYFCDPSGFEIVKFLGQMSFSDSLETSMASLNICDKYANLEPKEDTILASESKQNITSLNVALKSSKELNIERANVLTSKELDKVAPTSLKIPRRNSMVKIRSVLKNDRAKQENIQLNDHGQDMKTVAVEHLFENMSISEEEWEKDEKENSILTPQLYLTDKKDSDKIPYDSKEEEYEWERIKEANQNIILTEQISSPEDDTEKKIKTQNDVSNKQDEWKFEDTKKSRSLTGHITSSRNNVKKSSNSEIQSDVKKKLDELCVESVTKATIPIEEKDTKKKNSNGIQKVQRNNQDECEIIKKEKKIMNRTTQRSFPKRRVTKENSYKNQHDIKQEQYELNEKGDKKTNSILNGQMSSIEKNGEEKNKYRNSIQKEVENSDVRKFLKMLLVLGDKNGMSYVMETS